MLAVLGLTPFETLIMASLVLLAAYGIWQSTGKAFETKLLKTGFSRQVDRSWAV